MKLMKFLVPGMLVSIFFLEPFRAQAEVIKTKEIKTLQVELTQKGLSTNRLKLYDNERCELINRTEFQQMHVGETTSKKTSEEVGHLGIVYGYFFLDGQQSKFPDSGWADTGFGQNYQGKFSGKYRRTFEIGFDGSDESAENVPWKGTKKSKGIAFPDSLIGEEFRLEIERIQGPRPPSEKLTANFRIDLLPDGKEPGPALARLDSKSVTGIRLPNGNLLGLYVERIEGESETGAYIHLVSGAKEAFAFYQGDSGFAQQFQETGLHAIEYRATGGEADLIFVGYPYKDVLPSKGDSRFRGIVPAEYRITYKNGKFGDLVGQPLARDEKAGKLPKITLRPKLKNWN